MVAEPIVDDIEINHQLPALDESVRRFLLSNFYVIKKLFEQQAVVNDTDHCCYTIVDAPGGRVIVTDDCGTLFTN